MPDGPVLLTGASGFVGTRLGHALVESGREVRAMTRNPESYDGPGSAVFGDVGDAASGRRPPGPHRGRLPRALPGNPRLRRKDAAAATAFGQAAADAGVRQIVYLGGLGRNEDDLSEHLRSRREVEELLGAAGVPVTVLRAGIVIGAGGLSWEMTRQLVDHLPVMVTPRWVGTRTQPIAIDDVIRYLVGVLGNPVALGEVYEVGGPEVLRYADLLRRVAAVRRRPLLLVPVPLLTPGLSSRWLSLVTNVDVQAGRSLIDSMENEVVVSDDKIRDVVPFEPMGFDAAVRRALDEGGKS